MSRLTQTRHSTRAPVHLAIAVLSGLLSACADAPVEVGRTAPPRPNLDIAPLTTIQVTNTSDDPAAPVEGSLRWAIAQAAANDVADVITFAIPAEDPGCQADGVCRIIFGSQVTITDKRSLAIDGVGANIVLDGNESSRLFLVENEVPDGAIPLRMENLTLENGSDKGFDGGGCLLVSKGPVSLRGMTFQKCTAKTGGGGAIASYSGTALSLDRVNVLESTAYLGGGLYHSGELSITDSRIYGNSAEYAGDGGGIYVDGGAVTIERTLVQNNSSSSAGGVRLNVRSADIRNSTFTGNTGIFTIWATGKLTLSFVTVHNNNLYANSGAAATRALTSDFVLQSSIVNGGCEILRESRVSVLGQNFANEGCDRLSVTTMDAMLGELANNGGPTQTFALKPGSPAIDATPLGVNGCGELGATDQRGAGFTRFGGVGCDVGAFEVQAPNPRFGGFLAPARGGMLNRLTAGRALPVNFSLGGDYGLTPFASGFPTVTQIACPAASVARFTIATSSTMTGVKSSKLNYNSTTGQYTYVWVTDRSWAGTCRRLTFRFTGENIDRQLDVEFTR